MGQPGRGTGRLTSIGPYTLLDRIGAGGMGVVYRALDRRSGTVVAFKLLHDHIAGDPGAVERFRREAHVASLLRSSYAVHTLDFGSEDGKYYLVSEFIDGRSLAEILREGRPDPLAAIAIISQAALALDEAESRQVTHRDIKPDNILITDDGATRLGDFGIASLSYLGGLTMAGSYIGTVAYSAPEQHRGQADIRSDVYSLGVVLYEMLAGKRPFEAQSAPELMRMHERDAVPMAPLGALPKDLQAVVKRALEKKPESRYQHPSEFIAALNACRKSVAVGAPATESWMEKAVADMAGTLAFAAVPEGDGETAAVLAPPLPEPAPVVPGPAAAGPPVVPEEPGPTRLETAGTGLAGAPAATRIEPQHLASPARAGSRRPSRTVLFATGGGVVAALALAGTLFAINGGGGGGSGDDDDGNSLTLSQRRATATAAALAALPGSTSTATASASAAASPSPAPSGVATFEVATPGVVPTATTRAVVPPANTPVPPTNTPVPPTPAPRPVYKAPVFAPGPVTASGDPPANAVFSGGSLQCGLTQVIAYVLYSGESPGTVLVGNWFYEGTFNGSNPAFTITDTASSTWYEFGNANGLAAGTYGFVLQANGVSVSQGTVRLVC